MQKRLKAAKVPPVFRQAFVFASTLILTGVILGVTVNLWFLALSGLVGVGLLISGLIGICPSAILFTYLPWNNKKL